METLGLLVSFPQSLPLAVAMVLHMQPMAVLVVVGAVRVKHQVLHLLGALEIRHLFHHLKVTMAVIAKQLVGVALAVVALVLLAVIPQAHLINPMVELVVMALLLLIADLH
jgi:hypothetical protein